ncbi:uncharacterized protein [Ambystoma mexicanum]|uniref:uncharacterized protein isoform X1 n=1 Tax=Ambystoma mexicanum TaxID=8296 RepID=UPI0037E7E485
MAPFQGSRDELRVCPQERDLHREEPRQSTDVTCPGPSSAEEECNGTTAVYAAPGDSALLQITDSDRAFCPRGCVFQWAKRRGSRTVAAGSDLSISTPCIHTPDCRVLPGGSLELSRITPEEAGDYTLLMWDEDDALHPEERETRRKCFLLQLQGTSSAEEECNGTTAVYAAPGGPALLQVTDSDRPFCPGGCGFHWRRSDSRTAAAVWNPRSITPCWFMPDCRLLPSGSLELSRITPEEAGNYTLKIEAVHPGLRPGERETRLKCFLLQLQGEPESFWKRVIRIVRLVLAGVVLVAGIGMVRWHFT